ncbi:DUF4886 domain-containing protein [Kineothrix sp. MSJ-39]|uniref:DUF4886 domain-containing protein n=1 Tax=Kineothrix sp. MSJ-39 TaxID=2841533 RepID=UPI001C0F63BB|nr:DUF4886 domain-containing protein [Kineothrix sp. MSJ-39]MBU5429200.1 DUF4886 domain-containing protein [Kineothrix sp. MSJ-39]
MKKIKRYLAVWLVTCLFISMLLPTEAGAEETEAETIVSVSASSLKYNDNDAGTGYAAVSDNRTAVSENTELDTESSSISENDPGSDTVKILFVGNSFTRYHKTDIKYSVPNQLQELARLTGKKVMADCVTNGSARLRYYAGMSAKYKSYYQQLVTKLMEEEWDYVVLQEQSVVPAFSADAEMGPAVASLQKLIGKLRPRAKLLLYMTHAYEFTGSENRAAIRAEELQKRVGAAYLHIGSECGIDVVPVGMQFQRASVFYSDQQFLSKDGKHPSKLGYFVAACCFYQKIFGDLPDLDAKKLTANVPQNVQKGIAVLVRDPVLTTNCGPQEYLLAGEKVNMQVLDSTVSVKYSSLDKDIATVNSKGQITAVTEGTAVIVAQAADGRQGFCTVYVTKPLSFGRKQYDVGLGDSVCILPEHCSDEMEWRSSHTDVADVDAGGVIRTKKLGKTTIRVTDLNNPDSTASFVLCVTLHTPKNLQCTTGKKLPQTKKGNMIGYQLSWSRVNGTIRYQIYRSTKKNRGYELIGKTNSTSYRDQTAKIGQTYYYKVVAAGRNGAYASDMSDYVKCGSKQAKGSKIRMLRNKKTAVLSWKRVKSAKTYLVYRKQNKGAFKCIGTVSASGKCRFIDRTRKKGKKYKYKYTYKVVAM